MSEYQIGAVEAKFADIIWNNQPVSSSELVKICETELKWKKSTTYTVLKRLCDKGIFKNDSGCVKAEMTREEFYAARSEIIVEEEFNGSLPAFFAAFTKRKKLTAEEIAEIRKMIEESGE